MRCAILAFLLSFFLQASNVMAKTISKCVHVPEPGNPTDTLKGFKDVPTVVASVKVEGNGARVAPAIALVVNAVTKTDVQFRIDWKKEPGVKVNVCYIAVGR